MDSERGVVWVRSIDRVGWARGSIQTACGTRGLTGHLQSPALVLSSSLLLFFLSLFQFLPHSNSPVSPSSPSFLFSPRPVLFSFSTVPAKPNQIKAPQIPKKKVRAYVGAELPGPLPVSQ